MIRKQLQERVLAFCIILIFFVLGVHFFATKTNTILQGVHIPTPTPTHEPPFGTYKVPTIPKKDFYTIAMVGDSMTNALGPHGGKLSEQLNSLYQSTPGHQHILIDNYAQGGTNILEMFDQMNKKITMGDVVLSPLLSRQVDMILIESFGYNPLSQFPTQEGLAKQTQTLEQTMKLLIKQHPKTAIVFVATIAPNKETYAQDEKIGNLSDRINEAEERMAYIKNHIAFARTHSIPLIDIYDASLTQNGDGNLLYISSTDHIHPSFMGINFIDSQIANFIYQSNILPH